MGYHPPMPALLLHMTLAEELLDQTPESGPLVEACRAAPDALILGSVLPDLPYHARFPEQVVRHLARRDYLHSDWGDVLHTRGTGTIALAMLEHLRRNHLAGEERQRVLALCAGYICHHAADRETHPAIQRMVARHGTAEEPPLVTHSRIERYQNLLYHRDKLGHEICASPFPRALVRKMAGAGLLRPGLDPALDAALRAACLQTHGRAPTGAQVRSWLRGVTSYGELLSSPLGATEKLRGDLDALRGAMYLGEGVDLLAPLRRSLERTVEGWRAARAVLEADTVDNEARRTFLGQVPDIDLGMGA